MKIKLMARVKINIPKEILANIIIPIRITDINYGNHVGNDSFVGILHEVRVIWLSMHNYAELNIGDAGLIMSDLEIEFKWEAFYGDVIEAQISAGEVSKIGFELYYQLFTTRNNKRILLLNAKTGMICYNYTNKKVTPLPENFKKILTQLLPF